jgi:hypothetical protein
MNQLVPVTDIEKMAIAISKSNLFGIKSQEQAFALMLIAQSEGRHPVSVAMDYDIIQGKPALRAQAALKRFQEAGGTIEYIERSNEKVIIKFSHPKGGNLTVEWNLSRAKAMGLIAKDNWIKQPMIMMQWRCIAEGVRACFPACLGGSLLVEEAEDIDNGFVPKENIREVFTEAEAETIVNNTCGVFTEPAPLPKNIQTQIVDNSIISDAQRKRLFALAKENDMEEARLRIEIKNLGFESTKEITQDAYEKLCYIIETNKPKE